MSKETKKWLFIAGSLVILGLILFAVVMTMLKWDFTELSTVKIETNTYNVTEKFSNISIYTDTADIGFAKSDDGKCKVECTELEKVKHSVSVQDGTLSIKAVDERKWFDYIGINFNKISITVYVPENEYETLSISSATGNVELPKNLKFKNVDITESTGNVTSYSSVSETVKIKTSTGNIRIENISAGALDLTTSTGRITVCDIKSDGDVKINVTTGKVNLKNVNCKNVISGGSTGSMVLKNVIASGKYSIERTTGNVMIDASDAGEISIRTSTGNISGTLLSDKVFIAETSTGNVDVPKTTTGGKCELKTSTGNIKMK